MEFSEFAFRVILLFLPGILCGGVVDALTIHRCRKPFTVILRALVFGMGAYYLYGALILFGHGRWIIPHKMIFFRALQDKQVPLPDRGDWGGVPLRLRGRRLVLVLLEPQVGLSACQMGWHHQNIGHTRHLGEYHVRAGGDVRHGA